MSLKLRSLARSLPGILLAVIFLYVAFRGTKFDELWSSLKGVDPWWIATLIPVNIASHYVRAMRWKHLITPLKKSASTRKLFSAVMVGYMVNTILPRVGEVVRAYVGGKLEGISKSSMFGTVVIERIIDLVAFMFLLCGVLFAYPESLSAFVKDSSKLQPIFLAGSVVSLGLFLWMFLKSESLFGVLRYLVRFLPGRLKAKANEFLESFLSGLQISKMKGEFLRIGLLSLVMWGFYGLALYIPFLAFEDLSRFDLGYGAAVILLTVSAFAFILPAPGAFGTFHSFLSITLIQLYQVDSATALSYSIVTHETGYLIIMVLGIVYFLKDHLKIAELKRESISKKNDGGTT